LGLSITGSKFTSTLPLTLPASSKKFTQMQAHSSPVAMKACDETASLQVREKSRCTIDMAMQPMMTTTHHAGHLAPSCTAT